MERYETWFPFTDFAAISPDTVLVFCFHHAGGTASAYRKWADSNDRSIAFVPVELPGKGCRSDEAPCRDMQALTEQISRAADRAADGRRYVLYGHSMGAAIAFKTAYTLESSFPSRPELLVVSGRHAPCISIRDRYTTDMDDSMLVRELELMGGTPREILENKELLQFFLPRVKCDYQLNESFVYRDEVLNIPIIAFAGSEDPDAGYQMLGGWDQVTACGVRKREFAGGHFFPFTLGPVYLAALRDEIGQALRTSVRT